MNRFILIEDNPDFPNDGETCWYWDTERPIRDKDTDQLYIAVQCYCDRNPNGFVRHRKMALLFTDQAEYYAVCMNCKAIYGDMQWSGGTKNPGWREKSDKFLKEHIEKKGWCEFCDPVFGNGGWQIR